VKTTVVTFFDFFVIIILVGGRLKKLDGFSIIFLREWGGRIIL